MRDNRLHGRIRQRLHFESSCPREMRGKRDRGAEEGRRNTERRGALVVSGLVKHRARKDTEVLPSWTRRIYTECENNARAQRKRKSCGARGKFSRSGKKLEKLRVPSTSYSCVPSRRTLSLPLSLMPSQNAQKRGLTEKEREK